MVKLVVTIIPDNEIWLHQSKAAVDLQNALAWARANSPIDSQVYRDNAYREGDFIRLLTIASDHDATYGKK